MVVFDVNFGQREREKTQPQAADQEQKINFVWPKIVPGRRRCSLVRRPDKGGFTVLWWYLM